MCFFCHDIWPCSRAYIRMCRDTLILTPILLCILELCSCFQGGFWEQKLMLNWNKILSNVYNSSFSTAWFNCIMQDCVVVGKSFKLEAELSISGIFKALVIPFLQSVAQCYLLNWNTQLLAVCFFVFLYIWCDSISQTRHKTIFQ